MEIPTIYYIGFSAGISMTHLKSILFLFVKSEDIVYIKGEGSQNINISDSCVQYSVPSLYVTASDVCMCGPAPVGL